MSVLEAYIEAGEELDQAIVDYARMGNQLTPTQRLEVTREAIPDMIGQTAPTANEYALWLSRAAFGFDPEALASQIITATASGISDTLEERERAILNFANATSQLERSMMTCAEAGCTLTKVQRLNVLGNTQSRRLFNASRPPSHRGT